MTATNVLILFWTLVILGIYTNETYKLRVEAQKQVEIAHNQIEVGQAQVRETQRQTEIQQRPFVIIYGKEEYSNEGKNRETIKLKNIGNGIAINIKVKDIKATINSQIYNYII